MNQIYIFLRVNTSTQKSDIISYQKPHDVEKYVQV